MSTNVPLITDEQHKSLEHTVLVRRRLEEQYSSLPQQNDTAALGMWLFLATEIMFFGTLFTALIVYRYLYADAFEAASVELKKEGIHLLTVCPGYVRTGFSENAVQGNELKRVRPGAVRGITAERVARATLRGYLKQKREVIVPWTMHIPVKIYQFFPGVVEWAMGRMAG